MASNNHGVVVTDMIAPIAPADIELAQASITAKDTRTNAPFLVTFNESFDTENPKDWPDRRKWVVTNVLSATGFNRIMVSTVMSPALSLIAVELHMSSAESVMALSIYLLATAFGPLVIGPLSEIYRREVVLHASNIWFLIWNIAWGFANTKELLITARFLAGFGASSTYALAGGVLGDRVKSLGVFFLIPLVGAAVGPIIGGFMTSRASWRWMFWSTSIFQAIMVVFSFTTFHETYAPLILKRCAQRLRRATGDGRRAIPNPRRASQQWQIRPRRTRPRSHTPVSPRGSHPIIQVSSIISAFNYGILYIVLSSFAELCVSHYQQSVEISGLHYIAIALGELLGSQLGGPLMDYMFRRMILRSHDGQHVPEFRIPLIFPAALVAPLGLFIYGWTAQHEVHWIAVDVGIVIAMFGTQVMSMSMDAYVIDAYSEHTSSAMAASQFLESLTTFLFQLFAPLMYDALGYGWGNSALAFAGLLLGIPAPLIVWKYGARLRVRAASTTL